MKQIVKRTAMAVGLFAATGLVVVLALQNRSLDARYRRAMQLARWPHAGIYVPTFQADLLTGESVTIGNAHDAQLLFVFTTTCPYCAASLSAWNQIASTVEGLNGRSVSAYGVSLDPPDTTRQFAARHRLKFPVLNFPEPKLTALYRSTSVPVTLVLDSTGRVLYSRVGQFSDSAGIDSVLAVLNFQAVRRVAP